MKRISLTAVIVIATALFLSSCSKEDRFNDVSYDNETKTIFNISVVQNTKTKSGQTKITKGVTGDTKGETGDTKTISDYSKEVKHASLEADIAFGLVGVDNENLEVLVDNQPVYENNDGVRSANLVTSTFSSGSMKVSAFYPYVSSVSYHKDGSYAISFTPNDIKKGPLASNAVDMRCDQDFETVNLQFHHLSNSIGFKVCDITEEDQLKGLMHVRKVILHGMPTEGLYVVDGDNSHWVPNAKHQNIVIFEGNDLVNCGIENASFITGASLSDTREECNHVFVVPEELKEGKHYVEVVFDIDEFDYEGTHYHGATGKSQIIQLAGVLPDNDMEKGLQYTFVLGMNIYTVYRPIEFTANVKDYEVKFNGHILDYDNE